MKRLLITGGAGFIGGNFVHHVLQNYDEYECIVLDALTYSGNPDNLPEWVREHPRFSFLHGDIRDRNTVENVIKNAHIIINFAAESHVDRSIDDPTDFLTTNILGTANLLEACKRYPVELFIHISTPEVYGTALTIPMTEEHPLKPMSPYAGSKAAADRLLYSYHVAYDIPSVILKPSNNYGPYQYPEKLIPLFITNALENKPLPIYGSGKNLRDWIYVRDTCEAIIKTIRLDKDTINGEEINIATSVSLDVLTISKMILERLNKPDSLLRFIDDRPGHLERFVFSTDKMRGLLKWSPEVDIESGLDIAIEWYQKNRDWWERIKESEGYTQFYHRWYSRLGHKINNEIK